MELPDQQDRQLPQRFQPQRHQQPPQHRDQPQQPQRRPQHQRQQDRALPQDQALPPARGRSSHPQQLSKSGTIWNMES